MIPLPDSSPSEFLTTASADRQFESERLQIQIQNALTILGILAPAALQAAAGGNVIMRDAVYKAWPYLGSLK